jgi:aminoglycoside 6-adenylyltransferase
MESANKLLKSIEKWVKEEDNIRVAVLIGSRAQKEKPDRLAGIDLDIFAARPADLVEYNAWTANFGNPWLSKFTYEEDLILWNAVYEDGMLLAFYIQPLAVLDAIQKELPPYYLPQYKVLVDKDHLTRDFPKTQPSLSHPEKPSSETFTDVLQQFWLDAYYTARYLWRGELWRTKHYDWQLKQNLLLMLSWHATLVHNRTFFSAHEGDHLSEWVDPDTYTSLMPTFGRLYPADAWRALEETVKVFSQLAREVAPVVGVDYPDQWEDKFMALEEDLKTNPKP